MDARNAAWKALHRLTDFLEEARETAQSALQLTSLLIVHKWKRPLLPHVSWDVGCKGDSHHVPEFRIDRVCNWHALYGVNTLGRFRGAAAGAMGGGGYWRALRWRPRRFFRRFCSRRCLDAGLFRRTSSRREPTRLRRWRLRCPRLLRWSRLLRWPRILWAVVADNL